MTYYFCLGKITKSLVMENGKGRILIKILGLFSFLCHLFIQSKLVMFKRKTKQTEPVKSISSHNNNAANHESMFSLAGNAIVLALVIGSGITPIVFNIIELVLINIFQSYLLVYLHQHITPEAGDCWQLIYFTIIINLC